MKKNWITVKFKKPIKLEAQKTYGISVSLAGDVTIKELVGWDENRPIYGQKIYDSKEV